MLAIHDIHTVPQGGPHHKGAFPEKDLVDSIFKIRPSLQRKTTEKTNKWANPTFPTQSGMWKALHVTPQSKFPSVTMTIWKVCVKKIFSLPCIALFCIFSIHIQYIHTLIRLRLTDKWEPTHTTTKMHFPSEKKGQHLVQRW